MLRKICYGSLAMGAMSETKAFKRKLHVFETYAGFVRIDGLIDI